MHILHEDQQGSLSLHYIVRKTKKNFIRLNKPNRNCNELGKFPAVEERWVTVIVGCGQAGREDSRMYEHAANEYESS